MTLKFALEAELPGVAVWLDQDQRNKTEGGMRAGVLGSRFFLLYLTQGIFARYFCKLEIRTARRPGSLSVCILILKRLSAPCLAARQKRWLRA